MKKIAPILILISSFGFGQIMEGKRIDENKINSWNVRYANEYEGIYFFGFGETKSRLILSINKRVVCAQLMLYRWVEVNEEQIGWRPNYFNRGQ